jgi:hypothetical protein
MADRYARSRARDEAARAALEPLAPGERPTAVTVAAVLAFVLGLLNVVLYLAGLEIQGERPKASGVLAYSGLMFLAAWGMWRARYWAVLGMQALLAIVIVIFSILVIRFENLQELLIGLAVIGAAGTLFWFLVKAMARIQMPDRP